MTSTVDALKVTLADTYALYLKTQNFHWHVTGPNFPQYHELLEQQYTELAGEVDEIAERIRTLGATAPGSFTEFNQLKTIKDGDPNLSATEMLETLGRDHDKLVNDLKKVIVQATDANDEGTVDLIGGLVSAHEKMRWMLKASKA